MKLKSVTLLAAITQLLSLLFGVINYVKFLMHVGRWDVERLFDIIGWSIHIVAALMLAVFLFTLVSRQKTN